MAAPKTKIQGANHHRAKYSAAMVERARQLHDQGRGYETIPAILCLEYADANPPVKIPPWHTVRDWCAYRTRAAG